MFHFEMTSDSLKKIVPFSKIPNYFTITWSTSIS